jgi:hypothetical protein
VSANYIIALCRHDALNALASGICLPIAPPARVEIIAVERIGDVAARHDPRYPFWRDDSSGSP